MFEQLFGSKTRVKLMKLFIDHPNKIFFVRELTRLTDTLINSIRRELEILSKVGFVEIVDAEAIKKFEHQNDPDASDDPRHAHSKKYYKLNKNNLFLKEIEALFSKSKIILEKQFAEKIKAVGEVKYLALSGFFMDNRKSPTDLLIIGYFQKDKIQAVIKGFEADIKRSINYTLMDLQEYRLRKDISDRFLLRILEDENNLVVIDELKTLDESKTK